MEDIELRETRSSSFARSSRSRFVLSDTECSISHKERLLTQELSDTEKEIQFLIEKYKEHLDTKFNFSQKTAPNNRIDQATTMRPINDNVVKLKEKDKIKAQNAFENDIQMQTHKEINNLRRAMRKLRRWRNGSQQFTYRNIKKLREFLSAAKNKFVLASLQMLHRENSYFSLQTMSMGDLDTESPLNTGEVKNNDLWTEFQSKIKKNVENGIPLFKIENINEDLEALWTNLQHLKSGIRLNNETLKSNLKKPSPDLIDSKLNEDSSEHQALINDLLRTMTRIKKMIDAFKTGYHINDIPSVSGKSKNSDQSWKSAHVGKSKSKKCVRFQSDEIDDNIKQKSSSVSSLFNDSVICSENDITVLSCHLSKLKKWLHGFEVYDCIDFEKIIKSTELMEYHLNDAVNLNKSSFFLSNSEILVMNKELDSDFSDEDIDGDQYDEVMEMNENKISMKETSKRKHSSDVSGARNRSNCSLSLSGCNPEYVKLKILKSNKNRQVENDKSCEDVNISDSDDVEDLLDERLI